LVIKATTILILGQAWFLFRTN